MAAPLNDFDFAFVVDTTGSMGPLIGAARRRMIEMIDRLAQAAEIAIRLAVVEYRDFPPQDTMIRRVHAFTPDLARARRTIDGLKADGGGDEPEAVFAGLVSAAGELEWRRHARRIALLVGDAPPHGVGYRGDSWGDACPSGETIHSTAAKLEAAGIRLFALGLRPSVAASFGELSRLTGGQYFSADQGNAAISHMENILQREFGELQFDRAVYDLWTQSESPRYDETAGKLATTEARVIASISRLAARELLTAT